MSRTTVRKTTASKKRAPYEEFDWYATPKYYDAIFDVDSEMEANFLEAVYAKHATPGPRGRRRVLEPACGSGRLLVEMAKRGWKVHGFDLEPAMVEYSRERLAAEDLTGSVAKGDMSDFKVRGTFDLAHCFVSTFKYLLTEEAARGHLQSIARALRPGGIYALGFHLSWYEYRDKTNERWTTERDGARIDCTIVGWPADRAERREKVQARMKVIEGGVEKRSKTTWWFRSYDAAQVRSLLRSVPELEHIATYDFHYEIDEPQTFSDEQCDTLLILRRKG
ncbi:MAG: class I SAM-dependent methyltransferase [Planctomycetota bacterium]